MEMQKGSAKLTKSVASLGVGCIQFRPKAEFINKVRVAELGAFLEEQLSLIPSISGLKVSCTPTFEESSTLVASHVLPDLAAYEGRANGQMDVRIEFDLTIPRRIGEQLLRHRQPDPATLVELFHVLIVYDYYVPVMFVFSQQLPQRYEGSSYIFLIREFLKEQLGQNTKAKLEVDTLGPSPMHVDFELFFDDATDQKSVDIVEFRETAAYGEADVLISGFSKDSTGIRAALTPLANALEHYYQVVLTRNSITAEWNDLDDDISSLFQSLRERRLRRRMALFFTRSRMIRDAIVGLGEFAYSYAMKTAHIAELLDYAPVRTNEFFAAVSDRLVRESREYPVKEISDTVKFLEGRDQLFKQAATSVISAVMGGMVGAVLVWLLT